MIPRDFITEWSRYAPWSQMHQIEQDLVVCRALVEIFSQPVLADNTWNFDRAYAYILEDLIILIPGDPWRGYKI